MALLTMSQKEIDRYGIITKLIAQELHGTKAAHLLNLSVRHVRRLKARVRTGGARSLIHTRRGQPSNRCLPEKERDKIERLLRERYPDFGPTLACEKLRERHGIMRDPKTIRALMRVLGLWQSRPRRCAAPRHWRQRREHPGELVQFDGSYECWFEDRGPRMCLLAAIDDATGKILHARFAPHEGVFPVFGFWKSYLERYGKPRAIYLDKFSTYKQNRPAGEEDGELKTQFQRACRELGMEPIFANSPQAKGRVERLFKTLQDRLIKELRLQHIATPERANAFLTETFIPDFNRRFSVPPVRSLDLHRALRAEERQHLDAIFSRQETRTVRNDYTVSFKNAWYQLVPTPRVMVRPKERVRIEEWLDGTVHLRIRQSYLRFTKLPDRPKRAVERLWVLAKPPEQPKTHTPWKPPADHPWRAAHAPKTYLTAENELWKCARRDVLRAA